MATNSLSGINPGLIGTEAELQPNESWKPLGIAQNTPSVPLEKAVQPLIDARIYEKSEHLMQMVATVKEHSQNPVDGLTTDESGAIRLYTESTGKVSKSLNEAMRNPDRSKLNPWHLFLVLFLNALSKLPWKKHHLIWRGMSCWFSDASIKLKSVHFSGFTSCSSDVDVATTYLNEPRQPQAFLVFSTSWAKDITGHSSISDEKEALVLPGTCFRLSAVVPSESYIQYLNFEDDSSQSLLLAPLFPGFNLSPPLDHKSILELKIQEQADSAEGRFVETQLNDLCISHMAAEVENNNAGHGWKTLDFFNNMIGSDGAIHIRRILAKVHIDTMNLGQNRLGSEGVRNLTKTSGKHDRCTVKSLTNLVLFDNKIDKTATEAMGRILQCYPSLTKLNLGTNRLGFEGLRKFFDTLGTNQNLAELVLWDTKLDIIGAKYLAKILPKTKLTVLNIGKNKIGDVGCQAILNALPDSLIKLDLNSNKITQLSVKLIVNAICKKSRLVEIVLSGGNPIKNDDECVREIRIAAAQRRPYCDVKFFDP